MHNKDMYNKSIYVIINNHKGYIIVLIMPKNIKQSSHPLKHLSGPEIETLADYVGQGALGVQYTECVTGLLTFHPITKAYDNQVAHSENSESELCISTDANRSEEGNHFPMRTCMEFRSGPKPNMTQTLLHLVQAYASWLTQQKSERRENSFVDYAHPTRQEQMRTHYLRMSHFITYYNALQTTKEKLQITDPKAVFHASQAGPEFSFSFPDSAVWVLKLDYDDLDPRFNPVFFTQHNVSIPIGCVFDQRTRNAFPLQQHFSLLNNEKELAADFNESRPHSRLRNYEQSVFSSSVLLADHFSSAHQVPNAALGMRDFLRGMVFELAMISTSQRYLIGLFQEEALWIATQHQKQIAIQEGRPSDSILGEPKSSQVHAIAHSLSNTLRKSLFSYFMKTTLATFFKQLHPYEKHLLQQISKTHIKTLCQNAVHLANGGLGNAEGHDSHFISHISSAHSFMVKFDDFYEQTFKGRAVAANEYPTDPMACLTDRFISPSNIGSKTLPVFAVVVEIRQPEQGNQEYEALQFMYSANHKAHDALLTDFYVRKKNIKQELETLWRCCARPTRPHKHLCQSVENHRQMQKNLVSKAPTFMGVEIDPSFDKDSNRLLQENISVSFFAGDKKRAFEPSMPPRKKQRGIFDECCIS